jgi:hypothetical protein
MAAAAARTTIKAATKRTATKSRAKKPTVKKAGAKKAVAKRTATKKPAKKTTAKKNTKKAVARRPAKKAVVKKPAAPKRTVARAVRNAPFAAGASASQQISARIAELGDWRGDVLGRVRTLIKDADPAVVEEWKWEKPSSGGTPVWSHKGIICTGESYKEVVKLTFFKGASLADPASLFNSSLEGNARRAIDIREGEPINEHALKELIRAAVALNMGHS